MVCTSVLSFNIIGHGIYTLAVVKQQNTLRTKAVKNITWNRTYQYYMFTIIILKTPNYRKTYKSHDQNLIIIILSAAPAVSRLCAIKILGDAPFKWRFAILHNFAKKRTHVLAAAYIRTCAVSRTQRGVQFLELSAAFIREQASDKHCYL